MLVPEAMTHQCTKCSHETIWKFQLDRHIQRNHRNVYATQLFRAVVEPELYLCTRGTFESSCKLSRYEHCRSKHVCVNEGGNDENDLLHKEFRRYSCDNCTYTGHSNLTLVKHHDLCKIELKYPVEHETSPATSAVKIEIDTKNSTSIHATTTGGFHCAQCSYNGRTKKLLQKHMVVHSAAWYNCPQCSYQTKRRYHVKLHMRTHAEIWLNCAECSYRTKKKGLLKRHMVTHAAANWFSCTECSYRAKRRPHLKSHMLTHAAPDDISWFQCTQCSYRSKRLGNLNRHMHNHATDGEKKFSCTECSYRSKGGANLKMHMATHGSADDENPRNRKNHTNNWLRCDQCSYRTQVPAEGKKHMLTHVTGNNIVCFKCPHSQCSYRSKQHRHVIRHMHTHAKLKQNTKQGT